MNNIVDFCMSIGYTKSSFFNKHCFQKKIVNNVTDGYDIKISDESKEQLVGLMKEVNDLDIDYSEVKNALEKAGDTLKDNLKELGVKLKDEGFFEKIGNWFKDLWNKFLALFEKDDTEEKEEPKEVIITRPALQQILKELV